MTQMLLFDSPSTKTVAQFPMDQFPMAEAAITEAAGTVAARAGNGAGKGGQAEETNVAAQLNHDSGLHRMGDLARLVLLRYELVAKRRALLAARKAAKSCK